jgi:HTH-type transcriptional regulator/antitoxin HigA
VVELSLLENNQITRIACRRLAVTEKSDFALLAWAQEAKLKARSIETSPIDIKELIRIIPNIRQMTVLKPKEFCPKIKGMLAECGIALVFLPHLKGSFLQGASFIDGNKIVVGLTARGKDADKFWFSLFHELAHIILGHIGKADGTTNQDEKDADTWSRDTLIPEKMFDGFRDKNDFSAAGVCAFAKELGIAPGIVVGRLQNEGCVKHSILNNLKEHYEIVV